ncbi:unnamed protein product [Phytomonas sp. Hart1]|nr:unnamed protein product [Phytomonas sp. Hart1]|eukprot:CCW66284.1 unnamed protein product [Phytomonas sp. isolate Hart1]
MKSKLVLSDFCNENGVTCCPITEALFNLVHREGGDSTGELDARLEAVQEELCRCMDTVSGTDTAPTNDFQPSILNAILRLACSAVQGEYTGFPGPMCSPFRRSFSTVLRYGFEYTLTEKSDGIRVLVVSLRVPCFPRWLPEELGASLEAKGKLRFALPTSLVDLMSLEKARRQLANEKCGRVPVRLSAQTLVMGVDTGNVFTLENDEGLVCRVVRCIKGRHFSYMFDRSMNCAYLLLEEYPFHCECCVVDGELMKVIDDPRRPILGLFDLYSYKNPHEAEVRLTDSTMPTRYEKLKDLVKQMREAAPCSHSLEWFVKEMWPVCHLKECLNRLECRGVRDYIFHGPCGPTKNDGIIFTPNVFPITGGSSRTQIKWKWPSLLSIDWLISPVGVVAGDSQLYDVWLFFRKKNFNYRVDVEGHWRSTMQLNLLNPHGYSIVVGTKVVAECVYVVERNLWSIERIRYDRLEANSIVTIVSVFESLVENVHLRELCALLGISDEVTLQRVGELQPSVPTPTTTVKSGDLRVHAHRTQKLRLTTQLTLRAILQGSGTKLSLCWYTNKGNPDCRKSIPCALCEVRECSGLGLLRECDVTDSGTISLTNFLYIQLGNAGGSYAWSDFTVDAYFDGTLGHWVVVKCHPHGRNYACAFDGVLLHLSWLLAEGRGDAAKHAIPSTWYGPAASLPPIKNEETQRTNIHYAGKVVERRVAVVPERSVLLRFNNWIKSALIDVAVQRVRGSLPEAQTRRDFAVVDVCCGRGGDLLKWKAVGPAFVFFTDASHECVAEAAARYSCGRGLSVKSNAPEDTGFRAYFDVHDAFDRSAGLQEVLLHELRRSKKPDYHLFSCQFSLHYGCSSLDCVEAFVTVVSSSLAVGGLFIGTTVSDRALLDRFRKQGLSFGNTHYHVFFPEESVAFLREHENSESFTRYGVPYFTTVEDAVSNLPEYVVPWDMFCKLCSRYNLHLVLERGFVAFFEEHQHTPDGQNLIKAAKRSRSGMKQMALSTDEMEAASMYRVFIFEKKGSLEVA